MGVFFGRGARKRQFDPACVNAEIFELRKRDTKRDLKAQSGRQRQVEQCFGQRTGPAIDAAVRLLAVVPVGPGDRTRHREIRRLRNRRVDTAIEQHGSDSTPGKTQMPSSGLIERDVEGVALAQDRQRLGLKPTYIDLSFWIFVAFRDYRRRM